MSKFEHFPLHPHMDEAYWTAYDSTFSDYMKSFTQVDLDRVLEFKFKSIMDRPDAVIVDLMSSTRALESLHVNGFKGRLIAVGLGDDSRKKYRDHDYYHDIDYIRGDLKQASTWNNLAEALKNQKADIIMEHGYGGLHWVPTRPLFQRIALSNIWEMLDDNSGVLALQTPSIAGLQRHGTDMDDWRRKLTKAGIYNVFGEIATPKDPEVQYGVLIAQKNNKNLILPDMFI